MTQNPVTRSRRRFMWPGLLLLLLGGCALVGTLTARWALDHTRTFAREMEQAARAVEVVDDKPLEAVTQAQVHLMAAQTELDALRPVAEPTLKLAGWIEPIPGAGAPVRQMQALWAMAHSASSGGLALTRAAELALPHLKENPAELVAAAPAIQEQLNIAEEHLITAQAARNQLEGMTGRIWLPEDISVKTELFLTRWDENAPPLLTMLPVANQLLADVDIEQSWENLQVLSEELQQLSTLLAQPQQSSA